MSADDFQTKYASVMESMLKSAVAETTKLFETMVDELKAEISRIKQENEVLKMRCKQFESERSRLAAEPGDGEPLLGCGRRDTAVQCGGGVTSQRKTSPGSQLEPDLVPLRTVLVERCQPLRYLSLNNQEQQCGDEEIKYALQESNCDAHSQMDFILVKHEEEEVYPTKVCRKLVSDKAGSTLASVCRIENEGDFIHQDCSTGEIPLLQKDEETRQAVELLQGPQTQSPEREHSVVISLAAINEDMEEPLEVSQKISEIGTQGEHITSQKQPLMVALHQSDVEPLEKMQPSVVPQQTDVTLQQNPDARSTEEQLAQPTPLNEGEACDKFRVSMAGGEAGYRPEISVPRRRGRPPKKRKYLQQPVKEILHSPHSDIPAEQEVKNSPAIRMEEADISSVLDTVNITSPESPQASLLQPEESLSIIMSSAQKRANTALEDKENSKVGSLALSVASLSRRCSSEKEKSSESQHPSMDIEEASIQAPPIEVSSAIEKRNTPPTESPLSLTVQSRERRTSATLQDAMLLVEAMNRSTPENTFFPPQRRAAQTQCAPHVGTLEIVQEIPAEPQKQDSLPVETHEATGNLPATELSPTKSTVHKHSVSPQTPDVSLTDEAQAHIKVALLKQAHAATLCRTTTSSVPLSTTATQTSVQSLQKPHPHPLITSVAPSKPGNTVPNKIIVVPRSSLMPPKILALSPTQIPNVVSTVVAKQNNSILPGSTASGCRAPSIPSVPQKTVYVTSRKSLPSVTSQSSTTTSTDPQSGALPRQKITIIIPRQVSGMASRKHQSQTNVLNRTQESDKSATPVTAPLSHLISSSKELLSISADTQMPLNVEPTILSQKRVNTSSNLESLNKTACVSETINAQTDPCSNLQMSAGPVPAHMSPGVSSTSEEKLSAVVRLTRFPFPVSTKESVLVSKLPTNGFSEAQSILKEGGKLEKPSFVFVTTQRLETHVFSTDSCPNLKQTSAVSVNSSQRPEEPNDIQEKATNMNKSSAVSDTAGKPTSNVDAEIISMAVQDCALPIDSPIEENQSAGLIHLTSITSKDISDPHLQTNKSQFLAQQAESPVAQDPKNVSSNDSVDAEASCAETSTSDKKTLQKRSLMAQLRSHLKDHMRPRRTKTNPEPQTEAETPNDKNTSSELSPVSPKNTGALEDVASLKKPTVPTSIRPKRTVSEPSYVRRSKATNESTSLSPRRSNSGRGSKNEKSTSMSPRRYSSNKAGASLKKTQNTCVRPKRTSSSRDGASSKMTNTGGRPNTTKTISVRPKRTSSCRDSGSLKKTEYTSVRPSASSLNKNGTVSKMSTNESTSCSRRSCTLIKDGSSTEQIKKESNYLSPKKCSISTDGASTKSNDSETVIHSIKLPKSASESVTLKMSGESTPAKKPRLSQDGNSPKNNLRVVNAKKLAKAAKAKTIAKVKNSSQSELRNGVKTNLLAENHASCEVVKRGMAKAVWTPPRMPASKTSQLTGKMSSLLSLKEESRSPTSLNRTVVYPPSVSLHPIPVRGSPIVSPLQPLSVIGRRLLKNQCGECGRVLSSSAALESHVSLHTGNRPFSCTLCGKRFPDSKGFKRHGRVHRNGRIHICPQCGKGFVYRFGLTKHLQMVHGRIKPFVCQICNKGFFTKRDVEAHIRIHTGEKPFHCNLCEKKFTRRVELNVHLRWHNGEKRHWCPYCGKGFLDFNNLKRHKYIHTGEKPHSCPHCPKNFTQSGHLKKHIKNVHKVP